MPVLSIDLETRSPHDLPKVGLRKYLQNVEILLAAWQLDNGPVEQADFQDEHDVAWARFYSLLADPGIEKRAFNAPFEMGVLRSCGYPIVASEWVCTMSWAYARGFTGRLHEVGKQIGLPDDRLKRAHGTRLITKFSCPPFADPGEHSEDWEAFRDYNRQDVVAEKAIADYLAPFPLTSDERKVLYWDWEVNSRGLPVDMPVVEAAITLANKESHRLLDRMRDLTGLDNPNSQPQLLGWLQKHEYPYDNLQALNVRRALARDPSAPYQGVLGLRQAVARAATKKYLVLRDRCVEDRIHDTLQFSGAGRTGRWGGRGFQVQNLVRPSIPDPEQIAQLLHDGYSELVEAIYT